MVTDTAWKTCKFRVFSGPYFPVIGLSAEINIVCHFSQSVELSVFIVFQVYDGL